MAGLGLPVLGDLPATAALGQTPGPHTVSDPASSEAGQGSGEGTPSATDRSLPFILSEGLAPVPAKLVARITKGEFVDMADLLRDNLEARRWGDLPEGSSSSAEPKRSQREVPDLLSWVQCFGTYMAVVTSSQPERVKQLLAYQTVIVREARRCGGRDWQAYDSMFRQQAVGNPAVDWSKLNPTLYAVTFLTQSGTGKNCVLCMESDHREEDCALSKSKGVSSAVRPSSFRATQRGSGELSYRPPKGKGQFSCFAWNKGECNYFGCKYRHTCVKCGGEHRLTQCRVGGSSDHGDSRELSRRQGRDRSGADGAGRSG